MKNQQTNFTCCECAKLETKEYIPEFASLFRESQLCSDCHFWQGKVNWANDPVEALNCVRVKGQHFHIAPPVPTGQIGFRGHGGRKFLIKFLDGRVVSAANVWHQGTIPERFKARLPDNATFGVPCNYCDKEAKQMLIMLYNVRKPDDGSLDTPHCGCNLAELKDNDRGEWFAKRAFEGAISIGSL